MSPVLRVRTFSSTACPPLSCSRPANGENKEETPGSPQAPGQEQRQVQAGQVCSPGSGGCLPGVPAVPGDLLDLRSMIEKVTGKNALTNYGFYGCYCGWGGRGTPKDDTDW